MANANQSANRAGNVFGRDAGAGFAGNDWENIVLKPGYILKIRDRFHLVEAVEGLTVDLFFNDSFTATLTSATAYNTGATDDTKLLSQYGLKSTAAILGLDTSSTSAQTARANMVKPSFDSGFIEFKDLEPYRGHLYHLCPSVPVQPKFMDINTGDFLVSNAASAVSDAYVLPSDGGFPVGFKGSQITSNNVSNVHLAGTVSPKVYLRHPAGVPKWVLDEAPEGSSGSVKTASSLEGLSGFIDGQISPIEDPDWTYSLWIESGENNLPSFKMVNDSEELLVDARVHLQGWKYRIVELGMDQLKQIRDRSGGRLTFKIINPAGIPTPGTLLADYFPR
tara:strand:- start:2551 stop:3558 length:1008 start_codon:yes stop_codon:yes gene_type:complete